MSEINKCLFEKTKNIIFNSGDDQLEQE
jgi:hypothetical protein